MLAVVAVIGGLSVAGLARAFAAGSAVAAVLPACRGGCGVVAAPLPLHVVNGVADGDAPLLGGGRPVAEGSASVRHLAVPSDQAVAERLDPGHWREVVASYHDWNAALMLRVAWCESRDEWWQVDPLATPNGKHARGVLQVLGGSLDPVVNVREAHARYVVQGMSAWDASRSCWERWQ